MAVNERKAGAFRAVGDWPSGISKRSHLSRRQAKPDDPRLRLTPNGSPSPKGHISPVMIHTNFLQILHGLITRTQYRRNDFSTRH